MLVPPTVRRAKIIFTMTAVLWTLLLGAVSVERVINIRKSTNELAATELAIHHKTMLIFRKWVAFHGGVYVPVTATTPPNPYVEIPEREITAPSGIALTLMNPAYVLRQIYEVYESESGVKGHLTSLNPIRPANAPDDWERVALSAIERGEVKEVSEQIMSGGKLYLRALKPFYVEKPCLKCHERQGYKIGDLRGGISTSIPMEKFITRRDTEIKEILGIILSIWLLGICGIGVSDWLLVSYIRKREEAEAKLRDSERKYRQVMEQASEGIFVTDQNGRYLDVNPAGLKMIGFSIEEMRGMAINDIIPPDDLKRNPSRLHEALSGKTVIGERTFQRKDGSLFRAELSVNLLPDGNVMAVKRDITARKQAEIELLNAKEQAEAATRLKDQFVELVAHDLRSPLASILSLLNLFKDRMGGSAKEEDRKVINLVFKSIERMIVMTEDLLKVSRFQTGKITLQPRFLRGYTAVTATIQSLTHNAAQKGVEIINEVPREMRLYADKPLFDEVLLNLLSNAIKFCSSGDRITFYAPQGLKSAIAIKDTGKGIDEKILSNLFRHEVNTTTPGTAGEVGTGLGLPYCYDIMKAHGGDITVESAPGEGAVFCVNLPYVKPVALAVDDDPLALMAISSSLGMIGVEVIEAMNGEQALAALKDRRPHIIITDLKMPGMDGFALLDRLKQENGTSDIPVVVMTAADSEMRDNAFRRGASDFVGKPIASEDLIPRVRRIIG